MNILLPKTITPEMLGAATNIPVVDASVGEVAWVSGTNYVVKDRRVHSGYVYECVKDITSAPQNTYAPSDVRSAGYWLIDKRNPTNRTAPFDKYPFTKARYAEIVNRDRSQLKFLLGWVLRTLGESA